MQIASMDLTDFEQQLYARQLPIDGLGMAGQRRLKSATVLISRVGGLGGTAAMLLARAGIGRLVLAHDGVVEPENLNRMPLAFREHLGQPRIAVFRETLARINPDVQIIADAENIHAGNVGSLMEHADVVIDGAPLFEERYVLNREAMRQGKPSVMAAQFALEGYVTTFIPGVTPCLECLYPNAPADWHLHCFPVIAPISTLVATIAATEAIKLITGFGSTLANSLWYCNLETNRFRTLHIARRPDCSVCGTSAGASKHSEVGGDAHGNDVQ